MKKLAAAFMLLCGAAHAAQAPDTPILTGPSNQQVPVGQIYITPPGGRQMTLGNAVNQTNPTNSNAYAYTLRALNRLATTRATDNIRVNPSMTAPAWAASTTYGASDVVSNGGSYYEMEIGLNCVSASSGGPSGSGSNIIDGTCNWKPYANVVTNSVTPTVTYAAQWAVNKTYLTGATVVTYTGSGTTAMGNFYTLTGTSPCTSAASGSGPSGTGSGITDNTCTWNYSQSVPTATFSSSGPNSFLWNGGAGSITSHCNFYGGTVSNSAGTSYETTLTTTVAGTFSPSGSRMECVTNSLKFVIRTFDQAGTSPSLSSAWRIGVCNITGADCQYVQIKPYSLQPSVPAAQWGRMIVDFSSVGGHEPRDIIIENDNGGNFGGIDVLATEDVWLPGGEPPMSLAITGDSYPAGGGLYWGNAQSFPNITADQLGFRNIINTAIGGCGYIVSCASGTAIARITDVTKANNGGCPDAVLDANGTNDVPGSTPDQIVSAQTAYLAALRAACGRSIPIVVMGLWAHNNTGSALTPYITAETAMAAAVAAMNDPFIIYVPFLTDPAGAWQTGSGVIGNAAGNASFATNVMTAAAPSSGTYQIGMYLTAAGVTTGTQITSFGTGTGGAGTYNLSTSPGTIVSEAVTGTGQNGTGNSDWTLEGRNVPPNLHPNAVGNRLYSERLTAAIRNFLNAAGY